MEALSRPAARGAGQRGLGRAFGYPGPAECLGPAFGCLGPGLGLVRRTEASRIPRGFLWAGLRVTGARLGPNSIYGGYIEASSML